MIDANSTADDSGPVPKRPSWSEFRDELERAGFRPSKGRGQNFLIDTNMAAAIARDAGVGPGDRVLEIGPGCGFLSVHLAALGVRLLAVEIEPRLATVARRFLAPFANVELIEADVLAGKHRLAPEVLAALPTEEPWHVVANLPYSIVGPVLVVLARLDHPPRTMTVLVQRELADRIAAAPGDAAWSGLSAKLQARYAARMGRPVSAQLFSPRPRVESAVVRLVAHTQPPVSVGDLVAYDELVETLFQSRRKTLKAILRNAGGDAQAADARLAAAGVDPRARPGELSVEQLVALAIANFRL